MQRLKDDYLTAIRRAVPIDRADILEIGCGDGTRSVQVAAVCKRLIGIEPDSAALARARAENSASNIEYVSGNARQLQFDTAAFDIVIFTLSFHHVPEDLMQTALDEAARVVRPEGHVIIFEPAFDGSFFDAEIRFDACDGDERRQKKRAYEVMHQHRCLREVGEIDDETVFKFDSLDDFIRTMCPKKGTHRDIEDYLRSREFILTAKRRINFFRLHHAIIG